MAQLNGVITETLLTRTLISCAALGLAFGCGVRKEVLTSNTGGAGNSYAQQDDGGPGIVGGPGALGGAGGGSNTNVVSTGGASTNVVSTGGASTNVASTGGAGGTGSAFVCPSSTGHVTQLPSGTCSGTGSCDVVVDVSCGPGITAIPATPPTYNCQCASGNWSCSMIAAGFGLMPCTEMDAGVNIGTGGSTAMGGTGGSAGHDDTGGSVATGGTAGSTTSPCVSYETAASDPNMLVEACKLASADQCTATLTEYIAKEVALGVTMENLVEGCGSRSVGWDVGLGGRVYTYDSNGQLIGYYIWDDIPFGPCGSVVSGGSGRYTSGTGRMSLRQVNQSCASDTTCGVALPADESLFHCTIP